MQKQQKVRAALTLSDIDISLKDPISPPPNEIVDPAIKRSNKHSPKGVHYRPPSAHQ